jgi:hypothetical protein
MKTIVLIYVLALVLCLFIGGIVSLGYHYSVGYYFLLLFLALPAKIMTDELFRRINKDNLRRVTILTAVSFFVMLGLLVLAAYLGIDEKSNYGMVYAVNIASYILGLTIIGLSLPKRWDEKRRIEKKFPYS